MTPYEAERSVVPLGGDEGGGGLFEIPLALAVFEPIWLLTL